jgi:hypothetical protein
MKTKSRLLLCVLVRLLCCAARAAASGFNLGWNDSPSGATYALAETFACDTNVGTHTMVGSFVAPPWVNAMTANEIVIDIATSGAQLPAWWTYGTSQRRPAASLVGDFDFTGGSFTCTDYWQNGAIGAPDWSANITNRCRIRGVFALSAGSPLITSLTAGTEYHSFKCRINDLKSTGLGACAGCADQACIVLNILTIQQLAPNPVQMRLTNPANMQYVLWQGWSATDPQNACPAITPARQHTWGSIKALYR